MTAVLMFIAGGMIGACAGILTISIMRVSAEADRQADEWTPLDHRINNAIRRSNSPAE